MAFQLWKVVGGSKLLLLPFTGIVLGGAGAFYSTYRISRSWTGSSLGVDFNEAGSICQAVSTAAGVAVASGFAITRHSNYRPLPFREILAQMERELHRSNQTVTRTVNSSGTVISTQAAQLQPRPASRGSGPNYARWLHDMKFRTRLFLRAARVPARFHLINILGTAVLLGSGTSVAQRLVCGRTGTPSEVGRSFATYAQKKDEARAQAEQRAAVAAAERAEPVVVAIPTIAAPTIVADAQTKPADEVATKQQ